MNTLPEMNTVPEMKTPGKLPHWCRIPVLRLSPLLLVLLLLVSACAPAEDRFAPEETAVWKARAETVTIKRDTWGIPHIHGQTDADAVFGMIYAQAEDDFNRIEVNFLTALGRTSEAEGEDAIWQDLRMRLFIDEAELKRMYADSPVWLRDLMDAWAAGLNWYLHTHPEVEPRVLDRFEPWMALSFSEGSIGGDIERVSVRDLEAFYGQAPLQTLATAEPAEAIPGNPASDWFQAEPTGSNGFAIAPSNTANGNALLLINPHTSFYFRAEVHMTSDEGLNAYGAVTWGQFFIYQGFNQQVGWMHTSSQADNMDEYLLTVVERGDSLFYLFDGAERPLQQKEVTLRVKSGNTYSERTFTTWRSHQGPVIRAQDGKWVAFRIMEEPLKALQQSYLRTKAGNYTEFRETMEFHTNSSNNTVYADADGTIAYFHSNFIPIRDAQFDFTQPVDGSTSATDWKGLHSIDESIHIVNPVNGWIQNTNNWPFSATGANSPRKEQFPPYMSYNTENARGLHALRVLEGKSDFTLESLRAAAYDSYLTAFDGLLPGLFSAYDAAPEGDSLKTAVAEQVELLRKWDRRFGVDSVPTSVAIFWGTELMRRSSETDGAKEVDGADVNLVSLAAAKQKLTEDFGQWNTPWGEINRFQRLTGDIVQPFDDSQPSLPVGFTSATWGSLAAYGQRTFNNTKRIYGTRGNSFVAVVEFGDSLKAVAISAGGQSGDPDSPHFNDQAELYSAGQLRTVYFYPEDIDAALEREYNPGL